jgi:hypothetical protein
MTARLKRQLVCAAGVFAFIALGLLVDRAFLIGAVFCYILEVSV